MKKPESVHDWIKLILQSILAIGMFYSLFTMHFLQAFQIFIIILLTALPVIFSTQLGYMLGNKLYYTVKKGKFSLNKIRDYFKEPFIEPDRAFESYIEISSRLKTLKTTSQY